MILAIDHMRETYSAKPTDRYAAWAKFFALYMEALAKAKWDRVTLLVGPPGAGKSTFSDVFDTTHTLMLDAPNLTYSDRAPLIAMAKHFKISEIYGLHIAAPLGMCLERNAKRKNPVPEDAIRRRHKRLRWPALFEGFTCVKTIT